MGVGEGEAPRFARAPVVEQRGGSPVAVLFVDRHGRVTSVEGAELTLFGEHVSGLPARSLAEWWDASAPVAAAALRGALAGKRTSIVAELDDETIDLEFEPRRSLTDGAGGCMIIARACSHDELPPASHLLRLVFDQVPGALWATDRELRLTHIFGRLAKRAGLTGHRLIGVKIADVIGARDPDHPAVAGHVAALGGDTTWLRYDFRGRRYSVHVEALRDAEDRIVGTVGVAIDVTEREEVAEALLRSREQLAEAQRVAHVGSWEWDVARNQVTWSDELYRIYNVDRDQFDGSYRAFLERVHPDDVSRTEETIRAALRDGGAFAYDHRIVRPGGEVRVLQTRGQVFTDSNGAPARLVGSCWDVTEHTEATRQLHHSVSLLRATLDATADGLAVVDRGGRLTAFNRRFVEMWNLPEELVLGREDATLLSFVMDQLEDAAGFTARVRELYDQPEATSFDVIRFKNGRVVERYSRPQLLDGEVVGRVWSFRDVTDREGLLERAVFLSDASRLLASLDIEQGLEAVARLAVPLLGEGCAVDLMVTGGPRRLLSIQRDAGPPIPEEPPRAVQAGHPVIDTSGPRATMAVPLMARDRPLGALTFRAAQGKSYDESDLRLAEELSHRAAIALDNARLFQQAREALHVRDEFLSVAAHEIRGPVTSIHLATQTLGLPTVQAPMRQRSLAIIEREDRRLSRFVDELLDVGRIRSGRFHFNLQEVDLAQVAREAVSRMGPDLSRSGSSISLKTDGSAIGTWDRTRLDQIVSNLLANAVKFGLGRPVEVRVESTGEWAELSVIDHGIGISREAQRRIFDPFERGVSARQFGGLGLGLYIVKTIANGLGGSVRVESQPGGGAKFTVQLPKTRA